MENKDISYLHFTILSIGQLCVYIELILDLEYKWLQII